MYIYTRAQADAKSSSSVAAMPLGGAATSVGGGLNAGKHDEAAILGVFKKTSYITFGEAE